VRPIGGASRRSY